MARRSVLVIGCGSIGERHLRCFQHTGRTQVTACDANPARLAALAKAFVNYTLNPFQSPQYLHIYNGAASTRRAG